MDFPCNESAPNCCRRLGDSPSPPAIVHHRGQSWRSLYSSISHPSNRTCRFCRGRAKEVLVGQLLIGVCHGQSVERTLDMKMFTAYPGHLVDLCGFMKVFVQPLPSFIPCGRQPQGWKPWQYRCNCFFFPLRNARLNDGKGS